MCITEKEFSDRVFELRISYLDDNGKLARHNVKLYAVSKRGAMRKATSLAESFIKQFDCSYLGSLTLSSEVLSWKVHRIYDYGKPISPWVISRY